MMSEGNSLQEINVGGVVNHGLISKNTLPFATCSDARRHGFKKDFLRILGFNVSELRMAGFSAPQIAVISLF